MKPEARSPKPEARSPKPEARSPKLRRGGFCKQALFGLGFIITNSIGALGGAVKGIVLRGGCTPLEKKI